MTTQTDRPVISETEMLVLGGGAAGLQAAYCLRQAGWEAPVLERSESPGAFWRRFPRIRQLISFNKRYSIYENDPELDLRWDWNSLLTEDHGFLFTKQYTRVCPAADEMATYLDGFAKHYGLDVRSNTPVERVSRDDDGWFRVRTPSGDYRSRRLIVATGLSVPNIPPIPGIEHAVGYEECSMDPADYEGQRVLIIGKGNSAFEVADQLLDTTALIHLASENSVSFAYKTHHSGGVRSQYARVLDMYQLKTLHGALDAVVKEIRPHGDGRLRVTVRYLHADGESETFLYDSVIRAAGFAFDYSVFDESARPTPDPVLERFPAMTSTWESRNVPGMYFAGTTTQVNDFRRASSAFVAGFRYNARTLVRLLASGGEPEPACRLSSDPEELGRAVLERASRSSALWAQFGHLCDLIVVENGEAAYYEELPVGLLHESEFGEHEHVYTLTLEWGEWTGDAFKVDRHPRAETAHTNVFLHPIVRRYERGQMVAEHHVLEDLLGTFHGEGESGFVIERGGRDMQTYHEEEHQRPMREFFAGQMAEAAVA